MTTIQILTIISRCAMLCCWICLIIYFILLHREHKRRMKAIDERIRQQKQDLEAMKSLCGDEYWKAYAEYKKKYPN